ncbi:MAG: S46 family peptidase [Alistipes sp.]|nr:S46 family peptidase [Alistipes sp.]
MKNRLILCALLLACAGGRAAADEGMWLIQRLGEVYPQMKRTGLRLPAAAIYDEQGASLAGAVVAVDGGVGTGSMISHEGLMITNHHVAYSDICELSTPEHNYLETGFWAATRDEEIPVKGKTVSFLRRTVDVTEQAQAMIAERKAAGSWGVMSMRRLSADLEKLHAVEGLEAWCVSMWGGRKVYIYYYEIYRDVRLVGTPPVSIGAFGGETDNWSWPQHKGDFTLYRVYADRNGRPADYAADNVPLDPQSVLQVATGGVHDGDYTMVLGFPGRTNRYASSCAIVERERVRNPIVVKNRHDRMDILRRRMERNPKVRMEYSDAFFSLSNFADLALWENRCLHRFGVAEIRREEERAMQRWIEADEARRAEYGSVLADLERGYGARRTAQRHLNYFREAWLGPSEALLVANRVVSYLAKLDRMKRDTLRCGDRDAQAVVNGFSRLERNYDAATDRELLIRMVTNFTDSVPRTMWGEALGRMYDAAGGDAARMAGEAFDASFCSSSERYRAAFAEDRTVAELRSDPLVALAGSVFVQRFTGEVERAEKGSGPRVSPTESLYARALYDFREAQGKAQYPNANSTMRLTYGKVAPLTPSDAVHCDARSTIRGYAEKYDPSRYDFRVDDRMRSLVAAGDWGRWGEKGELYVNFLTDNDITGGNSGSPVLDGRGRLVGLAFDGNRESMAADLYFHPRYARTVCVDIRFVMWVIEHYAGAGRLLDEIAFVK